jgi:VIT1/CCC1 family predicted Fe2+/Mn2+ transporter
MTEHREEELPEAETGVDPIVLLVLSMLLLSICGLVMTLGIDNRLAFSAGMVGLLIGAVMFCKAAKRISLGNF